MSIQAPFNLNKWIEDNPQWLGQLSFPNSKHISNIVFMGMGEPLDNTDAVIQSIRIMLDPFGFQIAPKRIVVSTAGHLDGLKKLVNEELGVSIALSLHAADSKERSKLLPINRRFPLPDVLSYLRYPSLEE